jgi:ribosomal protein L1
MAEAKKVSRKKKEAEEVEAEINDTQTIVMAETPAQTEPEQTESSAEDGGIAKAGKRSAKSLKEVAEKEEKEARKQTKSDETETLKPKKVIKPTRSKLERRGKLYRKSAELIEKNKKFSLSESVGLAKKTSHVKFDATVELHVNLGVDPRQADQNIRDTLLLPAGSGKKVRIAVLTDDAKGAEAAGADVSGTENVLALIEKGELSFDVLIATPALMPKLGKYARVLGPRGLMPSPKSGTVTSDVNRAVAEAKAGKVEYRVDSTGIVHLGFGKVSFTEQQLLDNVQAIISSIKSNKPNSIKGIYIKAIYITTSMGPSVEVDVSSIN